MPVLNSAAMKKVLAEKRTVRLENGTQIELQAGGVIWNGQLITEMKDVPTDEQIKKATDDHVQLVMNRR